MMEHNTNTSNIKGLLNNLTTELSTDTLDKLRSARTHALDHQRIRSPQTAIAWAGRHGTQNEPSYLSKPVNWAITVIFAACLISAVSYWQNNRMDHEITEVDIAILTGDLPIQVYLD